MALMKINKLLTSSALGVLLSLESAQAANIDVNFARMQAMDKITGKVSEIDIPVNGEAKFGSFSVVVRRCVTHSPEETPENYAFVDVADTYKTNAPINIFKGWMMSSSPALNAVEHPIYDVWLLKCFEGKSENKKLLSAEELEIRDRLPRRQSEERSNTEKEAATEGHKKIETFAVSEVEEKEELQTAPDDVVTDDVEKVTPEVISVVVTADSEQNNDDGAPKALLQIQEINAGISTESANNIDDTIETSGDENEVLEADTFIDEENGFEEDDSVLIENEVNNDE